MNAISPPSCLSSSHTHQWKRHSMSTSRQDGACSKLAGHSLFHVCYCKCKGTRTRALTVLPVLLLKDIYEEHQTPLWSFRSRPFSAAITWVDKGIPKANPSPSSLLWIRLFSWRWKFNRSTIYLQAFPRWWLQQLHAEGGTLCGPAAQLEKASFLSCLPYLKWEEKKHGHERICLSGFSKSLKNKVPSTWVGLGWDRLELCTGIHDALSRLRWRILPWVLYLPNKKVFLGK